MKNPLQFIPSGFRLLLMIGVLALVLLGSSFSWLNGWNRVYPLVGLGVAVLLSYQLFTMMVNAQKEVEEFAESVKYCDFSRSFSVGTAPLKYKHFARVSTTSILPFG